MSTFSPTLTGTLVTLGVTAPICFVGGWIYGGTKAARRRKLTHSE